MCVAADLHSSGFYIRQQQQQQRSRVAPGSSLESDLRLLTRGHTGECAARLCCALVEIVAAAPGDSGVSFCSPSVIREAGWS